MEGEKLSSCGSIMVFIGYITPTYRQVRINSNNTDKLDRYR